MLNKIKYGVKHVCDPIKQSHETNDFQLTSDKWLFIVEGETFDFYTGVGHREFNNLKSYGVNWDKRTFNDLKYKKLTSEGFKKFLKCSNPKKPTIKDLFYSLILDSEACNMSFNDWCCNFGYDSDSLKAQQLYFACQENGNKFYKVINKLKIDIEKLKEHLQDY